jgi:hypothetical protein
MSNAARIRVYTTTNVRFHLGTWMPLANPLVFTNGLLRVDGSVSPTQRVSSGPPRYPDPGRETLITRLKNVRLIALFRKLPRYVVDK